MNKIIRYSKIILIIICISAIPYFSTAQGNISIIPQVNDDEISHANFRLKIIWSEWGKVWHHFNDATKELSFAERLYIWAITYDDIITILLYFVKFLSQLWIAVWVIFIMYAWYKYMLSIFNWEKVPTKAIKNAIIWVIIVIFSYAILKTLTSLVGIS